MNRVLFIGSFLSKTRGTIGISEKLFHTLNSDEININLSSTKESKCQRILEIILSCFTFSGRVVHIDIFSGQAFRIAEIAGAISRYREKIMICTLHGGKLPEFYQQNPKRVERLLREADRILTPSLYLRQFFQEKGFTVDYLPNSIELGRFPYAVDRSKQAKLLWVRAFSPIYQPALAVETLYHVRKQFPAATLTMVGPDKGELHRVKDLIKALHLEEAVEVTGPVPNESLHEYYHSHSVFLNTTSYESFGVAVMEAAACGIPIVSTKVGEIPYLWNNGVDILLADIPDAEIFAQLTVRILSDRSLAQSLSVNARKRSENFDWELIKQKWLDLLS